jgi:DNA-binding CsgD family transcriptional regulator
MHNQGITILLICNSDVILKGMAEVLSGSDGADLITLHRAEELQDYPHLSGYILLIMTDHQYREQEGLIQKIFPGISGTKHLSLVLDERLVGTSGKLNIFDKQVFIINQLNESCRSFKSVQDDQSTHELSRREIDVLQLVSKGFTNKEVADRLSISIHTVISHRKNISEKTGIRSASGLTMYAILKKIIDMDEISTSDLI